MKLKNMVAPVVFGALSLAVANANAAGTDAGTTISNTATLSFEVNGATQADITSTKDFKVDVSLDFLAERVAAPVATTSADPIALPGESGEFYLVGAYELSNDSNGELVLTLEAVDAAGSTVSDGSANGPTSDGNYVDNIDLSNSGQYKIFAAAAGTTTPTGTAITEVSVAEDGTERVLVYANKNDIVGVNDDVLAATLTASGKEITVVDEAAPVAVPADDSAANTDAAVEFVFADTDGNNLESVTDALHLVFPDFNNGGGDPTDPDDANNGFVKSSEVVWDPINGAKAPGVDPKAIPEATIKYTITVRNTGSKAATNLNVTDDLSSITNELKFCGAADGDNCESLAVVTDDGAGSDFDASVSITKAALESTDSQAEVEFATFPAGGTATITFTAKVQ